LWRFHSVHHSTRHLDWISGFRNHPLDGVLLAPPFAFLLAAGVGAGTSGVLLVVQIVTGLFLHANVRWRWRPLQKFVITPEFHHWHHANEPDALNRNYAALLPVWDLMFRTFHCPADRRPTVYGVAQPVPTGIIAQLRVPLAGLVSRLRGLRHPRSAVRVLRHDLRRGRQQITAVVLSHR
jgi:sterol desaturase/sphingolipid hydroxylase (fatty acid hydroxylase superfamily)